MSEAVAVLFADPKGAYSDRSDVELWDESRDARTYAGSLPVVAHPPCHLWVNMAGVNFKRYGGPHNRPGNDGGCFMRALESVRRCGGVLEHPAGSFAWSTFALTRPYADGWYSTGRSFQGGAEYVCEVWQSAYGHKARKRTWLLYVGECRPAEMRWERSEGTHQVGWFDRKRPTLSKREASATPEEFANALVLMARGSRP